MQTGKHPRQTLCPIGQHVRDNMYGTTCTGQHTKIVTKCPDKILKQPLCVTENFDQQRK